MPCLNNDRSLPLAIAVRRMRRVPAFRLSVMHRHGRGHRGRLRVRTLDHDLPRTIFELTRILTVQIRRTHRFSSARGPGGREGHPGRAHCWDPDPKLGLNGATPSGQMIEGSGLLVSGCQKRGLRAVRPQAGPPVGRHCAWRGLMGANVWNPLINGPYDDPRQHFKPGSHGITDEVGPGWRRSEHIIPVLQTTKPCTPPCSCSMAS
jgi:hypothetical protein